MQARHALGTRLGFAAQVASNGAVTQWGIKVDL